MIKPYFFLVVGDGLSKGSKCKLQLGRFNSGHLETRRVFLCGKVRYWNKLLEKWEHLHPCKFVRDKNLTTSFCKAAWGYLLQYEKLEQWSVLLQPQEWSAVLLDKELIVRLLVVLCVGKLFPPGGAGGCYCWFSSLSGGWDGCRNSSQCIYGEVQVLLPMGGLSLHRELGKAEAKERPEGALLQSMNQKLRGALPEDECNIPRGKKSSEWWGKWKNERIPGHFSIVIFPAVP